MAAARPFELVRRAPSGPLAGHVIALTGYRETAAALLHQREAAPLRIPFVVSFGTPFRIALGRDVGEADAQGSFAAGLFPGPVDILSDGRAACLQVDFTPLGAIRLFGGALRDMAGRMVPLEALFGAAGRALAECLSETPDWSGRFDVMEAFLAPRLCHSPSPGLAYAWRRLRQSGGTLRVETLAKEMGWSRQRLHASCVAELGLSPKALARLLRFHRACALARRGLDGWAGIAATAGYADQAHLVRDFTALAGEPPRAWARRAALALPHPEIPDQP